MSSSVWILFMDLFCIYIYLHTFMIFVCFRSGDDSDSSCDQDYDTELASRLAFKVDSRKLTENGSRSNKARKWVRALWFCFQVYGLYMVKVMGGGLSCRDRYSQFVNESEWSWFGLPIWIIIIYTLILSHPTPLPPTPQFNPVCYLF